MGLLSPAGTRPGPDDESGLRLYAEAMRKLCVGLALLLLPAQGMANELDKLRQFVQSNAAAATVPQPMTLGQLLTTLRQKFPAAEITGRFWDPRSISIYRSHAGFHYGYDVAMPAGTVVPAAWPGKVVTVTPWYGQEHGISVVTGQREATYGHLIPLVQPGQRVQVGQAVGIVARNHVDVKMRGAGGKFIDFGAGPEGLSAVSMTPEQRQCNYLLARYHFLHSTQQLSQANRERTELLKCDDNGAQKLSQQAQDYRQLYEEGAIARLEYEAMQKKVAVSLAQLRSKPDRLARLADRIDQVQKEVSQARLELAEATRQTDVQQAKRYLEAHLNPSALAQRQAAPLKLAPLRPDLDELLAEGVISWVEYRKMGGTQSRKSE